MELEAGFEESADQGEFIAPEERLRVLSNGAWTNGVTVRKLQYLLREQHDHDGFDLLEGNRHLGDDVSGAAETYRRRPEATVLRSSRRSIGSRAAFIIHDSDILLYFLVVMNDPMASFRSSVAQSHVLA